MINKDLINDALWILSDYEGLRNYSVIEKNKRDSYQSFRRFYFKYQYI